MKQNDYCKDINKKIQKCINDNNYSQTFKYICMKKIQKQLYFCEEIENRKKMKKLEHVTKTLNELEHLLWIY
jgi:hypothetical protein